MKKKRKIAIAFACLCFAIALTGRQGYAQQDPLYTQYMDNMLIVNPGYAGSQELGSAMVVARSQWLSIDGAPETRTFALTSPLKGKRVGLGFSVMSDRIGPLRQNWINLDYSYFLQISENYRLGLGLKGGISFYRANLSDLTTIDPNDPVLDQDIYANFLPNVGVGFYLYSDKNYLGFSVPHLIENNITHDGVSTNHYGKERMHLYLIGGHRFDLDPDFQLKTSALVKAVQGAPVSFDITALLGFREKVWLGAMYRFDVAFGGIVQFQPFSNFTIGYSYDHTFNEIQGFQNGSHEIMLRYHFDLFGSRKQKPSAADAGL